MMNFSEKNAENIFIMINPLLNQLISIIENIILFFLVSVFSCNVFLRLTRCFRGDTTLAKNNFVGAIL